MRVSRDLNCLIIFARKCLSPSNSDERWPHIIISIWFGRSLQLTLFSEKFGPLFFRLFWRSRNAFGGAFWRQKYFTASNYERISNRIWSHFAYRFASVAISGIFFAFTGHMWQANFISLSIRRFWGKGERWRRKRERELKERNAWQRCFYWSLPPHTAWFDTIQSKSFPVIGLSASLVKNLA